MRTLIADDDPMTRLVLQRQLQVSGCDVIAANNGIEAWKLLNCDDPPRFAILGSDMFGMTGIQIVQKLREGPGQLYTYTLLLANSWDQRLAMDGIAAGADDYLFKPVDPQQLTTRLIVARRVVKLQDQLVNAFRQASFIADHDGLTGLYNHNAILKLLRREMARSARSDSDCAVLMLDVDFFKKINDTHGHFIGDLVLEEVAQRIARSVRPYDIVGRFGGEEFIVVAPTCDAGEAAKFGERIRKIIESEPIRAGDVEVNVTISVGVALGRSNMDAVLRAADSALYRAKKGGRNRVELAEEAETQSAAKG